MKERIRYENGDKFVDRACAVCGINQADIDELKELDVDGILVPYLDVGIPGMGNCCMCDSCIMDVKDYIWEEFVQKPYAQPFFGINIKKAVAKFLEKNKDHFTAVAKDYHRILAVHKYIRDHVKEMQDKNFENEELKRRPCPTLEELKKFFNECNQNVTNINGSSGLKTVINASYLDLTSENVNQIINNSELANAIADADDMVTVQITVTVDLEFEENASFNMQFLAIDPERSKQKKQKDETISLNIPTGGFTID